MRLTFTKRLGNSFQAAVKAFRFPTYGGGGGGTGYGGYADWAGGVMRPLPGAQFDYRAEAGLVWQNTIVYSLLAWQAKQFRQAPFCVSKPSPKDPNKLVPVPRHKMAELVRRPNPFWTRSQLWGATLLSLSSSDNGSAFWVKVRSAAGQPAQLWWVPHWMMTPMWGDSGTDFITAYRYRVEGRDTYFHPRDVVHFRNDLVNPENQRLSLAPFVRPLREICTENEGATFEASFLRNRGIPGVILSPKAEVGAAAGEEGWNGPTEDQKRKLKALWGESFTGDNAGGVFVTTLPMDAVIPQFSPDQMALPTVRSGAVARICATFGVDPMVVALTSEQKTYSNYEEANRAAWDHNVIPTQDMIGEQLDLQLLPDFSLDDDEASAWDRSRVPALQEDVDKLYKRVTVAVGGPWMTRNEGRAAAGLDEIDGGDELYEPKAPTPGEGESGGSGRSGDSGGERSYRRSLARNAWGVANIGSAPK